MKLTAQRTEPVLRRPDASLRAVLIFGPDQGLIRERAERLVAAVAGTPPDPFRIAELTGDMVRADPALLADEAAALSFTGGRRLVRLRAAGDPLTQAIAAVLAMPACQALLVVEAGDLSTQSSLRRLFEQAEHAAAMPCYLDDEGALRRLVDETLARHHLSATGEAVDFLLAHLGADRALSRGELEKLALYKGDGGEVGIDDVVAIVGDSQAISLSAIAYAACSGNPGALDRALAVAFAEGLTPIPILRAVAQHLQRLLAAKTAIAAGRTPKQAMESLKPKVIYRLQTGFQQQLARWPTPRLLRAVALITRAEFECKMTGAPQALLCSRALLQIAQAASASASG
jgi:DNA polymerase-3 subunit delta